MNNFISAMSNNTFNENEGFAYKSTLDSVLDFYYQSATLENEKIMEIKKDSVSNYFSKAFQQNPEMTISTLLYIRAIKDKGLGNRFYFRHILQKHLLSINDKATINLLVEAIKKGWAYWDDFFYLFEFVLLKRLSAKKIFADITNEQLNQKKIDFLFAKWFPRKGVVWQYMRNLQKSPQDLRRKITSAKTTEALINKKAWSDIEYSHVSSKAFRRHSNTFQKFDKERFESFLKEVDEGKKVIKADTIFPHEILYSNMSWNAKEAQWKSLSNLVEENKSFLPVIDCSGSMQGTPLQVAHALGIYLSERNKSIFKDKVLTFSSRPHWVELNGSLLKKTQLLNQHSEVANTDFAQVFTLILNTAVNNNVKQEELPNFLICLTDGQFDAMSDNNTETNFNYFKKKFQKYGYELPHIVFWNLRSTDNFPANKREKVTLISGASPNAFNKALTTKDSLELLQENIKPFLETAQKWCKKSLN